MPIFIPQHLRKHAISIGNQGRLLKRQGLAGTPEEVAEIFQAHFKERTLGWPKKRIVIYAHGGLVPVDGALEDIQDDIDALYSHNCYLVALIWRTGLLDTIGNMFVEKIKDRFRIPGMEAMPEEPEVLQREIESICGTPFGKSFWSEMKENAKMASEDKGAIPILIKAIAELLQTEPDIDIHLISHSAGSIIHAHMVEYIQDSADGIPIKSCTMWAPACTVDQFKQSYLPALRKDQIKHLNLFTLTDHAEQKDNAFIYPKSLLYLVANAFEGGSDAKIPLLGMSRYIEDDKELLSELKALGSSWVRTDANTQPPCKSHGGFSGSRAILEATMQQLDH